MTRPSRSAGQLESAVMDLVWSAPDLVTVRDVVVLMQARDPDHAPAYTTIMTVLDRLHAKGWVTRQPAGRAYAYRSSRSREEHVAEVMGQALDGSGDRALALEHFAASLPPQELAVLKRAVTQARRREE